MSVTLTRQSNQERFCGGSTKADEDEMPRDARDSLCTGKRKRSVGNCAAGDPDAFCHRNLEQVKSHQRSKTGNQQSSSFLVCPVSHRKETSSVAKPCRLKPHFPHPNGKTGDQYSRWVLKTVTDSKKIGAFKLPSNATLIFGHLKDTEYNDCPDEVDGWGTFFLPTTVQMQVIGYVEGTPYPCDQLVLMTCEDKKIYAYDEEELHLVATSWKSLGEKGVAYPALKSYYSGEAFKDMTKEDWDEIRSGPEAKRLDDEYEEFLTAHESRFLENLKISRERKKCDLV